MIGTVLGYRQSNIKSGVLGSAFHTFMELRAKSKLNPIVEHKSLGAIQPADFSVKDITRLIFDKAKEENQHILFTEKDFNDLVILINRTLVFSNNQYDPLNMDIIDVEKWFEIEVGEVKIRGVIDLITRVNEKTIHAIDWKTGNPEKDSFKGTIINEENLYKNPQIRVYVWAIYKLFDVDNVLFTIYFVKGDKPYTIVIDKNEGWKVEKYIDIKYGKISKNNEPKLNISWKCRFCSYSKEKFGDSGQTICNFFNEQNLVNGIEKTIDKYSLKK